MYALDRLGYRGFYDVYDHTGYGNTYNQLAEAGDHRAVRWLCV